MARVLIIDDDEAFRSALAETVAGLGHESIEAESGRQGLAMIERLRPDAVFLDQRMPAIDGIEVLRRMRSSEIGQALPVIVLTAFATGSSTIEAMKLGAIEHFKKPVSRRDIESILNRVLNSQSAPRFQNVADAAEKFVGSSSAIREVHKLIGRAAANSSTVLVTGETGTGKELVARLIHDTSERARGPFIAMNCAAIPRDLLESELFGHVRGAFTGANADRKGAFQQANGGTLMLDEIGDMGLDMQAKLLRVLEERMITPVGATRSESVDLRIVAATHRDLASSVGQGEFRRDLFFRLNVLPIHIPPLRERRDDIVELATHLLATLATNRKIDLTDAATQRLTGYDWPGNVRELRNVMERVVALVRTSSIEASDLAFLVLDASSGHAYPIFDAALLDGTLEAAVHTLEREMILRALAACEGRSSPQACDPPAASLCKDQTVRHWIVGSIVGAEAPTQPLLWYRPDFLRYAVLEPL